MTTRPGWYADPAEPTTQRYWDGEGWIGDPLPVDATPPPGPPAESTPATAEGSATDGPATGTVGGSTAEEPHPGGPSGSPAETPTQPPGVIPDGTPPPGWPHPPYGFPLPPGFVPPPPRPHGYPLAPFGPRLAARLIDIAAVLLLNVVVNGWFVWRYVEEVRPVFREILRRSMAGNSSTEGLPQVSGQADGLQVTILLIAAALWFAYEVPAIANGGQTFGKRLMGIKVVPLAADEPLGFGRSLRRWNLLGLPTFLWCCGLGFLLQLVDCVFPIFDRPLRQALHDKRAQTVVVQVPVSQPSTTKPSSRPADHDHPGDRAS